MNRETFLAELRRRLAGLPEEELEERLAFYWEAIDDRMEDGLTEEEAVAGIGSVETVVEQILSEIPMARLISSSIRPRRKRKGWEKALLILGSPVWLPLLIAGVAVVLSLYVVVWSLVICLWAVDLSLAAAAVGCLASVIPNLREGNMAGVGFAVGAALLCAGLTIAFWFICLWVSRGVIRVTKKALIKRKTRLVGKEV